MGLGLAGGPGSWQGVCRGWALPLPGPALQGPQRGRRKRPFWEEDFLGPFKECPCCLVPYLSEPIKPCTVGNYRLPEALSREVGVVQGVGEVALASRSHPSARLPGREGADTKAPIKLPQSRQLLQACWVGA